MSVRRDYVGFSAFDEDYVQESVCGSYSVKKKEVFRSLRASAMPLPLT